MVCDHIIFQAELTQQVWGATDPVVSHREFVSQSRSNLGVPKPPLDATIDDEDICKTKSDRDDEDFGEFETVNVSSDAEPWVLINYDKFENMESGVADLAAYADKPTLEKSTGSESSQSPPPSPLPRGYQRSTQEFKAFLHPMDFASESNALGDLLSFESSTYNNYTPLMGADAGMPSYARHGTCTERMWNLGKTAFVSLGSARQRAGKQAKHAVATWKTNFVDKEHEELARVVRGAAKVPMVVKTAAPAHGTRPKPFSDATMTGSTAQHSVGDCVPESWIEAERQAWSA
jgi:hypothetical protein